MVVSCRLTLWLQTDNFVIEKNKVLKMDQANTYYAEMHVVCDVAYATELRHFAMRTATWFCGFWGHTLTS